MTRRERDGHAFREVDIARDGEDGVDRRSRCPARPSGPHKAVARSRRRVARSPRAPPAADRPRWPSMPRRGSTRLTSIPMTAGSGPVAPAVHERQQTRARAQVREAKAIGLEHAAQHSERGGERGRARLPRIGIAESLRWIGDEITDLIPRHFATQVPLPQPRGGRVDESQHTREPEHAADVVTRSSEGARPASSRRGRGRWST